MATRLWGPNKVKALRNIGVAKSKQNQATISTPEPMSHHHLGTKYGGTTLSGHNTASPYVKLQGSGEPDSIVFWSWDNSYNYANAYPWDVLQTNIKTAIDLDTGETDISVLKTVQSIQESVPNIYETYNRYKIENEWFRSQRISPTAKSFTPNGDPNGPSRHLQNIYDISYFTENYFYGADAKVFKPTKTPIHEGPFFSSARIYTITAGTFVVGVDPTSRSFQLWDATNDVLAAVRPITLPSWVPGTNSLIGQSAFNKDGTKASIIVGNNIVDASQPHQEAQIRTGYMEYAISLEDAPNGGFVFSINELSNTKLDDSQDTSMSGRYPVALGYNNESTINELVIASVMVVAEVSNIGTIANPHYNEAGHIDRQFEWSILAPTFGAYEPYGRLSHRDHHIVEWGCDLVFESTTLGELQSIPLSWAPYGSIISAKISCYNAYVRGQILGVDATCRGATIALYSHDSGDTVWIQDIAANGGNVSAPIPSLGDFIDITTYGFGSKHKIYAAGTPIDLETQRPAYNRIADMSEAVETYLGTVSALAAGGDSPTRFMGLDHGGITISEQSGTQGHPGGKKVWFTYIDPDDLWTLQDRPSWDSLTPPSISNRNYPAAWLTAMTTTNGNHYGGIYSKKGLKETFFNLYESARQAQPAQNPNKFMPYITLGAHADNAPVGAYNTDWRFWYSKFAVGASWNVYTGNS